MNPHECLDNQQSNEIEAALKRFEDVCNSLEDQQTKLLDLEKRRKKLNDDLQSLRNEIKEENNFFRSAVNDNVGGGLEGVDKEDFGAMVEPATLDTEAIKKFIQNQKGELASPEHEMGLNCLKRHTSSCLEGVKNRLNDAVEPVQQHVGGEKCVITEIGNEDGEITHISPKPSRN